MPKKSSQAYISIALITLAIVFGVWLYASNENFIWYWGFGLAFGFVLQRSRVCFVSAASEPLITKSTEQFRAILVGILVSSFGITAIKYLSGGTQDMLGVSAISLPLVLGAFLFGFGMIFAGCCSSGMFVRVAEGYVIHIITLTCVIIGYLLANSHYQDVWAPFVIKAPIVFLPEKLGWSVGIIVHIVIILFLYWIARIREQGISSSNSARYLIGAIAVGILNVLHHMVLKSGWSVIGAFIWFKDKSSITLALNIRNLGLFAGALISIFAFSEFKLKRIRSVKQVYTSIVGGLFMGYGASIAGGCNINAFFNAAASLSLSGWIFMLFLFAGTFVGMKVLYKLM